MNEFSNKRRSSNIAQEGSMTLLEHLQVNTLMQKIISHINKDKPEVYIFTIQEYASVLELSNRAGGKPTDVLSEIYKSIDPNIYCSFYLLKEKGDRVLLMESLPPVQKIAASSEKAKESYSEKAAAQEKLYGDVKSYLSSIYKSQISKGIVSEKHIHALTLTLTRVDQSLFDKNKKLLETRTASRLYDWAKVHSSIAYPYLSLEDAANKLKDSDHYNPSQNWGFIKDKIILPRVESLDSDTTNWGFMYDVLTALFPEKEIELTSENDTTVPDITDTAISKNPVLGYVFIRILELIKSPKSATLRRGEKAMENDIFIRNVVDFYVLDQVRQKFSDDYDNLTYNQTTGSLRRSIKTPVEITTKTGAKATENRVSYVGYKLSDIICQYLVSRSVKVTENEPACKFFFSILDRIVEKWDSSDILPQALFQPANLVVRKKLRQGPVIENKKKGTTKSNLYIPFSFVKAAECSRIPENIKKDLTDLGSKVIQNLDTINSMSLKDQNLYVEEYEQYISFTYSLSDEMRKRWRADAVVPEVSPLIKVLHTSFPKDFSKLSQAKCDEFAASVKGLKIEFKAPLDNVEEQSALRAEIRSLVANKTSSRKRGT